jgi:hypothetical protein
MSSQTSNPFDWRSWPWMMGASPSLDQPILPGWFSVTNVTEENSSDPDTEQAIVAKHSYGRQLGRTMDALALLVAELPKEKQEEPAIKEFNEIRAEIDDIKIKAAARRLDRIADDLATLKESRPAEYEQIAAKLRKALKADG